MARWLSRRIDEIRETTIEAFPATVDGELSAAFSFRPITEEQHQAWIRSARAIHAWTQALPPIANDWLVLMEYAPPLITTRPDVLVVTCGHVVVVEAKTGLQRAGAAADRQALGYAADLHWFHPGGKREVLDSRSTHDQRDSDPGAFHARPGATRHGCPSADSERGPEACWSALRHVMPKEPHWSIQTYGAGLPMLLVPALSSARSPCSHGQRTRGSATAISDDDELTRLTSLLVQQVHLAATNGEHRVLLVFRSTPVPVRRWSDFGSPTMTA